MRVFIVAYTSSVHFWSLRICWSQPPLLGIKLHGNSPVFKVKLRRGFEFLVDHLESNLRAEPAANSGLEEDSLENSFPGISQYVRCSLTTVTIDFRLERNSLLHILSSTYILWTLWQFRLQRGGWMIPHKQSNANHTSLLQVSVPNMWVVLLHFATQALARGAFTPPSP